MYLYFMVNLFCSTGQKKKGFEIKKIAETELECPVQDTSVCKPACCINGKKPFFTISRTSL